MKNGFTLVELLIVIAVIAVLATILIVLINPLSAIRKAHDAERKAALRGVANALTEYLTFNGSYPSTVDPTLGRLWYARCGTDLWWWVGNRTLSGPDGWIPNLAPSYLKILPEDPVRKMSNEPMKHDPTNITDLKTFCYIYTSDGKDYKAAAHCSVESGPVNPGEDFYRGATAGWLCGNYSYAVYSPGAELW